MRGQVFSAMGLALLTTLAMVLALTLEHTENTIPVEKSLLGGRIKAAYYHIAWEYKNAPSFPTSIDVNRGCAPMVVLDTESDPIETLARPYVFYACGD